MAGAIGLILADHKHICDLRDILDGLSAEAAGL